jgi:hypothetical protein
MMMGPAIADPPECSPPQMPSHAMFVLHVKHNPHIWFSTTGLWFFSFNFSHYLHTIIKL